MTFALNPEASSNLLKDLIVSDIAPVRAKASADTVSHIRGMEEVEASNLSSRKEANEILERFEKVPISPHHDLETDWSSRIPVSAHFY